MASCHHPAALTTDGLLDLTEGAVYPALHRLEYLGFLASEWHPVNGRRRRLYRLTSSGHSALAHQRNRMAEPHAGDRQRGPLRTRQNGGSLMNHPDDSPIGFYLDDLFEATRALPPRDARYLLAETEAHLRDSADTAMADGAQSYEAELAALAAFGTVDDLVPRESRRIQMPLRRLAGQVLHSAMLLGATGAMTVGASGVAAGLTT